jgi:hypothetical protein
MLKRMKGEIKAVAKGRNIMAIKPLRFSPPYFQYIFFILNILIWLLPELFFRNYFSLRLRGYWAGPQTLNRFPSKSWKIFNHPPR